MYSPFLLLMTNLLLMLLKLLCNANISAEINLPCPPITPNMSEEYKIKEICFCVEQNLLTFHKWLKPM
jgi:hypothetical protein